MGFAMRMPGAACAYPRVAPDCSNTIAPLTTGYALQQLAYLITGAALALVLATQLFALHAKRDTGRSTQFHILLLLFSASVLVALRSIDPLGLNDIVPYVVAVGMSDACTGLIETALIVMLMFWIRVMEGDVQEYSPRVLWIGGVSISVLWLTSIAFPILQWYYWDSGDHLIERIKISVALLITLGMTVTVSIYGWKIHRRLEDIEDALSLEGDDYELALSSKQRGYSLSPTMPLPSPTPVRTPHGACCLRSKMLETLVGLHLVSGFVFVLQIYAIFRVETQNLSIVQCVTEGCTTAHMNMPIMPVAQVLGICTGIWIFRHV
ncbi:hypothetical protein ACHHYP_01110 [Achlya hypogyna]|uniref:Transmembrane protein n=1 Tax=Achlya hypogyna TaxID=1202772 RepID=A0A1V9Z996_ACHHY|nr:hypothetical protein ACHHYP_01110 [Achlya hypogyna]